MYVCVCTERVCVREGHIPGPGRQVDQHVLFHLPVVGPLCGDGGVLGPQSVAGQLVLQTLTPAVGRGGDRRAVQLRKGKAKPPLQITDELVLQYPPGFLIGYS